jgi:hypothetical protein
MTERTSTRFFLLKLFFPLIYAAFFIVQLFINFDTGFSQLSDRYQLVTSHGLENHGFFLSGKSTEPIKTKFRLNKRFQPAFTGLVAEVKCLPPAPVIASQSLRYTDPDRADPLHDILLLRGPPTMI